MAYDESAMNGFLDFGQCGDRSEISPQSENSIHIVFFAQFIKDKLSSVP